MFINKKSNHSQFARKDTLDDVFLLFYDVMLYGKQIESVKEKEEIEASYFAMCLLLPSKEFDLVVNSYGGLEEAYKDHKKIKEIANRFFVEEELVRCRIVDKLSDDKEETEWKDPVESAQDALLESLEVQEAKNPFGNMTKFKLLEKKIKRGRKHY